MRKFTWKQLQEKLSLLSEDQLDKQVCVSFLDDATFTNIPDLQFVQEDIYCDVNNEENAGTLEDLKTTDRDDFNLENYKLMTAKGTPFLWDGF